MLLTAGVQRPTGTIPIATTLIKFVMPRFILSRSFMADCQIPPLVTDSISSAPGATTLPFFLNFGCGCCGGWPCGVNPVPLVSSGIWDTGFRFAYMPDRRRGRPFMLFAGEVSERCRLVMDSCRLGGMPGRCGDTLGVVVVEAGADEADEVEAVDEAAEVVEAVEAVEAAEAVDTAEAAEEAEAEETGKEEDSRASGGEVEGTGGNLCNLFLISCALLIISTLAYASTPVAMGKMPLLSGSPKLENQSAVLFAISGLCTSALRTPHDAAIRRGMLTAAGARRVTQGWVLCFL